MHKFRTAVEARDFDAIPPMLAEDAIFRSPVVFKPFEGKDYVSAVLLAALRTLQDFRYETELASEDGRNHALVFKATVNGREVHGCDFIRENADGLIEEFAVMIRPLSAVQAVGEEMARAIAVTKEEFGVSA
ncbi:MAG: nuclear transport factor 2 family protein [Thermoleophilaceae bacterium]|nr:nuclear transport factor 2 family protein [Thermoleophilaceae bacterium]